MGQAIIIDDNAENRKRVAINLNAYVGANVIERENAVEALNLLTILPEVDLIITKNSINGENTAKKIIQYIESRDLLIPVIVLGDCQETYNFISVLTDPNNWQEVIKASAHHLGVTKDQMANRITPDFFPVPLFYFDFVDRTPIDLYLKVINDKEKVHYVKKIHENEFVEQKTVQSFINKKVHYLYIKKESLSILINFVCSRLSDMMDDDEMKLPRRIKMASHAFIVVSHQVRNVGLTPATIQLAQAISDTLVYSVNQIPHYQVALDEMLDLHCHYSYQLFHLASILSYDVIRRMEWGTQDHHERLTFASLFANVTLSYEQWSQIRTQEVLENATDLTEEHKQKIIRHALAASEILKKSKDIPQGSELIVKYHHGSPDGIGFAQKVNETFSPLANIYVIAEEVAHFIILQHPEKETLIKFINSLRNKFVHVSFTDILKKLAEKFEE
jgi:hypothetical protein